MHPSSLIVLLSMAVAFGAAEAVPLDLHFDQRQETKTVSAVLNAASPVRLDGLLTDAGSIVNEYTFTAGSSALSLSAGWLTAPPSNRTVGVNIDIFDFQNNLVASDSFQGVVDGVAQSSLSVTNLVAGGRYRMVFTGTAVGFGTYRVDLVDGAVPPPIPPLAAATPAVDHRLFDTHTGTKTDQDPIAASDRIVIDGALALDGRTTIDNRYRFTLLSSILSAGIVWVVGDPADPQRTVGVNVDLLDFNNNVILSDSFVGITNGQAFSQFAGTGLAIGTYTLVFTGTGVNGGGRYRIDLGTTATPPGFQPIVDPNVVPEPAPAMLLALGAVMLGFASRRRSRR